MHGFYMEEGAKKGLVRGGHGKQRGFIRFIVFFV